jgi:tetratricopeptide (TPR) repeat protein
MDTSFFKSEEFRSLLGRYEQMLEYSINSYFSTDDLLEIASYYMYKNLSAEAEDVISYARKLYPSDPQIAEAEVRTLLGRGDVQAARRIFNSIAVIDTPELQLLKAEVDMADGNSNFVDSLNVIMKGTNLHDDLALNTLDAMIKNGLLNEALAWIEKGLRRYPDDIPLLEAKADCLVEQRRMQEALALYNRLLDINPYNYFYWEQLGYIYYVTERYARALECFDYELATNEDADYAKMMQAYCHYYLRDYAKAYESFCELTLRYPGNIISNFFTALSLCGMKRYGEALRLFNDLLLSGELTTVEALATEVNTALIYDLMGETQKATLLLEQLLALDIPDINMLALHGAGLLEIHDKESLLQRHMELVDREPRNRDEILLELAFYIHSHGHLDMALTVLEHLAGTMYDPADIDAYIAYILWQMRRVDGLRQYIAKALDGKSNKLFELFGMKYDAAVTVDMFLGHISVDNRTNDFPNI